MNNYLFKRVDFGLLAPAIILVGISLATLYSLDFNLFKQQLIYLIISLIAYLVFTNIDYKLFEYFAKYIYGAIIIGLLLLLFLGFESKGAVRWIEIFGVSLQFSEIAKPFFVVVLAAFLSRDTYKGLSKFILSGFLIGPIFFLIVKQPDLGSALIYLLTGSYMVLIYGFPILFYVVALLGAIVPMPIVFRFLHDYQRNRILSFIHPTADVSGTSYNSIQALISIGSGGISGKGFGQATQSVLKFLPERHTDFIFATISESLGFVGGVAILVCFSFLIWRIISLSSQVTDKFTYLIVTGFYAIFIVQVFFNIGMNIGILPIVGITLPFVSYGGSSLLTCFIMLGILSAIRFDYRSRYSIEIG